MVTEVAFFQEQIHEHPVLRVRGRIRMPDLARWTQELDELVGRAEGPALLDMTSCSFFPSLAIPPLLAAHRRLEDGGSSLLIAIGEELCTVVRYLHLDDHLHIHPDLDGCLASAGNPRG